jgi:hypothetical protein
MACSKCNNQNTKCGCQDAPYTTMPSYSCPPDSQCPVPNPCSEYVDTRCTYYNGAGIWEMGIEDGRSLQSIIQQLILRTGATPDAADPCSTCQATWNLFPVVTTSTSITIAWEASATANTYQVEYQTVPVNPCTLGTWTLLPSQTALTANITSLTANTEYLIRVNALCDTGSAYSVIIKVSTTA